MGAPNFRNFGSLKFGRMAVDQPALVLCSIVQRYAIYYLNFCYTDEYFVTFNYQDDVVKLLPCIYAYHSQYVLDLTLLLNASSSRLGLVLCVMHSFMLADSIYERLLIHTLSCRYSNYTAIHSAAIVMRCGLHWPSLALSLIHI